MLNRVLPGGRVSFLLAEGGEGGLEARDLLLDPGAVFGALGLDLMQSLELALDLELQVPGGPEKTLLVDAAS